MLIIKAAITLRQREGTLFILYRRTKISDFRLGRRQSIENYWTAMLERLTRPAGMLHRAMAIAHAAIRASGQQPRVIVMGEKVVFIECDRFFQIDARRAVGAI